jgi:hypothetical protein
VSTETREITVLEASREGYEPVTTKFHRALEAGLLRRHLEHLRGLDVVLIRTDRHHVEIARRISSTRRP